MLLSRLLRQASCAAEPEVARRGHCRRTRRSATRDVQCTDYALRVLRCHGLSSSFTAPLSTSYCDVKSMSVTTVSENYSETTGYSGKTISMLYTLLSNPRDEVRYVYSMQ